MYNIYIYHYRYNHYNNISYSMYVVCAYLCTIKGEKLNEPESDPNPICKKEKNVPSPAQMDSRPTGPDGLAGVYPLSPTTTLQISKDDVCQVFQKQKRKKVPGPDCVTPVCLKSCADQLAPILTQIFNRSLELCEVPSCFKCSTIITIP